MNPEFEVPKTSRDVAESPDVRPATETREPAPQAPSGPDRSRTPLDKPVGELESVDDDLNRVEKRTTL